MNERRKTFIEGIKKKRGSSKTTTPARLLVKQAEEAKQSSQEIVQEIKSLKELIGSKDDSQLIKELSKLQDIDAAIKQLNALVAKLPTDQKIKNLAELAKYLKAPEVTVATDDKILKQISEGLKAIGEQIKARIVNQAPEDYIPVRRVQKVGNRLVFDDTTWSGGGSGGGPDPVGIRVGDSEVSDSNPMPVEFSTTDIEIGAVEIKDGDSDTRLDVESSGTKNAAYVQSETLAKESGGNLADIKTAIQIMDDWDESDRAKVNLIVGQAGVAGGSGTVGATTQRMTLATDVALPTGTNQIGSIVPDRPSQGTGRANKVAVLSNQTADATLYTVTAAKTFYLTSIVIGAFNTSTATTGILLVLDGSGGSTKIPIIMTAAGVAAQLAASAAVAIPMTFLEPIQFTTAVYMDITAGTVTYSVGMVGYEQ